VIASDATPLVPWMVIAFEPGGYFPGRTGCASSLYVVTPDGGVELRDAVAGAARSYKPQVKADRTSGPLSVTSAMRSARAP
jgi:Xaa-Pro aminopeptidase